MNEVDKLKNDILNTKKILKKNQNDLKTKIENGWLDDLDDVIESNTDDYWQTEKISEIDKNKKPKQKNSFFNFIKKIM